MYVVLWWLSGIVVGGIYHFVRKRQRYGLAGISIGYISRQLGHAGTQITSEHYAKWLGEDYVEPMALEPGEVPADLLARLSFRQLRQSASTGMDRNGNASALSDRRRYEILERETGLEPATLSLGIKLPIGNCGAFSATSTNSGTVPYLARPSS